MEDGNQNRTTYRLDDWGRIIGIVKADGSTEFYSYDFAGNMTSSTDGEGHTTRYEYGRDGQISAIVDPTGEKESYRYDGEGRLAARTDRSGVTVEFGYNLYGAPLFQKAKDSALGDFYEYTPEGLLKCAISAGMRYAYEYDEMGRMIRKSASGRTLLAQTYDKNGNKISQTDVTGKITQYTYSPLDLLEKVWDDGKELAAYDYNADGTIHEERRGPLHKRYWYDLDKNLTGIRIRSGEELLVDNQYLYDGNGNRTHKKQLGGETLYHYDPLNQVKKVEYPGYTEELFYDKAGNRTRRIAQGVEELYQYDPRNRLTAYTKNGVTTPFQYDNAGNLLVDDKARYSYDAFNRTVKVETFDGNIQLNRYDAEGLRYEMEENGNLVQFIFNQEREVVTEEDSTGLTRLIRATELIARSTDAVRTYYHYASDEMGSTTHIVDDAGAVQNRYEYDAWGNLTAQEEAIPNRFKYTGQQLDPVTQQYYLRARFYNPVIARFTQEDTYRGDGLNLYAYCANNPVYYVDPSGNASQCMKDAYLSARRAGMTKEAAYAHAKEVFRKNHEIENQTVIIRGNNLMTREQWNDLYSHARAENPNDNDKVKVVIGGDPYASYSDFERLIEAREWYDRAIELHGKLPNKFQNKTVASSSVGDNISGWSTNKFTKEMLSTYDRSITADAVMKEGTIIGHDFVSAGGLDHGVDGRYHASHSEKQNALLSLAQSNGARIVPIGISSPMCPDCISFFRNESVARNQSIYIVDPDGVHIFRTDGSAHGNCFSQLPS